MNILVDPSFNTLQPRANNSNVLKSLTSLRSNVSLVNLSIASFDRGEDTRGEEGQKVLDFHRMFMLTFYTF